MDKDVTRVTVTDVNMPFLSMVSLTIKWALASIPALIVIFVLFSVLFGMIAAITGLSGLYR